MVAIYVGILIAALPGFAVLKCLWNRVRKRQRPTDRLSRIA